MRPRTQIVYLARHDSSKRLHLADGNSGMCPVLMVVIGCCRYVKVARAFHEQEAALMKNVSATSEVSISEAMLAQCSSITTMFHLVAS